MREVRELTRYRKTLVDERVREIQRLEKELQDAGIKLSSVASRLMTKSGRAMVEALIRGERDPKVLADLAKGKMREKIPRLEEALVGRFSAHHAVIARQVLAHIDFLDASVAELDQAVRERTVPLRPRSACWSRWWAGAGTRPRSFWPRPAGTWPGSPRPSTWRLGAASARPTTNRRASTRRCPKSQARPGSGEPSSRRPRPRPGPMAPISAPSTANLGRRGPNKAAVAVANSMVVTAWHILTTGEHYHDLGPDFFRAHIDPARIAQRKLADLRNIGWSITTNPDGTITVAPPELAA